MINRKSAMNIFVQQGKLFSHVMTKTSFPYVVGKKSQARLVGDEVLLFSLIPSLSTVMAKIVTKN